MNASLKLTPYAVAVCLLSLTLQSYATTPYDHLIEQARVGNTAPLLTFFDQQSPKTNLSPAQINDWIVVSGWAGDDAKTIEIYQRHQDKTPLQAETYASVARAYRNLQQWGASASLFTLAIDQNPAQGDWYLAAAGALADGGQFDAARQMLNDFDARFPDQKIASLLSHTYVERAAGKIYDALNYAQAAFELEPQNEEIQASYLSALRNAGLAERALEAIQKHQWPWVDNPTRRAVEREYAAELVRISAAPTTTEAERFVIAQKALDFYAKILTQWEQQPPDAQRDSDIRRARYDRLLAFMRMKNAPAVLNEYALLKAQDPAIPDYALITVADAFLELRRPKKALPLYKGIEERTKNTYAGIYQMAQIGVFYSLVETEQIDEARAYAESYIRQERPLKTIVGKPIPVPNSNWAEAQQERASADFFADKLAKAEAKQSALLARAPGDSHIRIALASTYRNRGLPRKAAQELKIIQANENPRAPALMLEQSGTALQLRDWQTAEALVMDVAQRYPENTQTRRALRDWDLSQKAQISMETQYSDSNSPTALGEGAMRYSLVAYTAPINYNWRLFAGVDRSSGKYQEGYGQFNQIRGGVRWRYRDTDAQFELSTLRASGRSYTGLRAQASHQLNDHWQVSVDGARNTNNVPLRALRSGITANEVNAAISWQANESTGLQLSTGWMNYSDDNHRWSVTISGFQRLLTLTRFQLDGNIELYHSRNSEPGGPYFAPKRDWSALPGLTARHLIWREYERSWRQELTLSAGTYYQKYYGNGAYQQVRYAQQVQWRDTTDFGFQTGLTWRPYDGVRERGLFFGINFNHLF